MILKRIAVASGNPHKIKEIKEIIKDCEIIGARDLGYLGEPEEIGKTFKENAEIKAKAAALFLGVPALADDSGLCVEALGGAPSIYSARYSGGGDKENRALLLKNLQNIKNRNAYFESAVCLYFPDGEKYFGEGRTFGKILSEEQGGNGFGYDCIFFSDDLKKSFGLATPKEKDSVSHRFRAILDLTEKLK